MTSLDQEINIPNGKLLQIDNQSCALFYLLKSYQRDFDWYFTKTNWNYLNTVILDNIDGCIVGDINGEKLPNEFIKYMYTDLKKQVFKPISVGNVVDYLETKLNLNWGEEEVWDSDTDVDFFLMNELIDKLIKNTILNKPYGSGYERDELYKYLKKKLTTLEPMKNSELLLEYKFYSIPFYSAY